MLEINHVVIHVDSNKNVDEFKHHLDNAGVPFEPTWGKKAKGFKVSNIWFGMQYFEIVNIVKSKNLWLPSWAKRHAKGERGTFCILFKIQSPISDLQKKLRDAGYRVTEPERTTFKGFLGLFEKQLPWRFCLTSKIPGTNIELGFIEYDAGAEEQIKPYLVPNGADVGLTGLSRSTIYSDQPMKTNQWIRDLQLILGEKLNLSVVEKLNNMSLSVDVKTSKSNPFSGVGISDVVLLPDYS